MDRTMKQRKPKRLLAVGHSYVVHLNRGLLSALAQLDGSDWEITVVAPEFFRGGAADLRPVPVERGGEEHYELLSVPAHLTGSPHTMFYGARLRGILRQGWDLVFAWEEPYVIAGAQIAALVPRDVPLVYYTFQNIAKQYVAPVALMERLVMRRASGWIAAGWSIREALQGRAGYTDKPSEVLTLGVDTATFRPDAASRASVLQELGWTEAGPPVIGYLGRFVPEKGLSLLLRVLERVKAPYRVLFVGSGALEPELRDWAERRGADARVVTGVAHDAVPRYMNAMDMLCAPSQTTPAWREQFGRMVVEAFACGVAVITSDSGELPHVVDAAGTVVPEASEPAWLAAIEEHLSDPAFCAHKKRAGLDRAMSHFSWPAVAQKYDRFLRSLIRE
jgi:glycosyltransferase involved in cell wall biosynthesis